MTKKQEKSFKASVTLFIDDNFDFDVKDNDPYEYLEFTESLHKYDGFNYELQRFIRNRCGFYHVEYKVRRTVYPYKYFDLSIFDRNIYSETAWVNTIDYGEKCKYNIFHYKFENRKQNACQICNVCGSIKTKELQIYQHNQSKKHINNVIMYNDTIKETLNKKKIGDDMINEIMSYL